MIRLSISIQLLIFFLITNNYLPQTISKIEVHGNKVFSENNYLSCVANSTENIFFNGIQDTLKKKIYSFLSSEGYFHSNIEIKTLKVDSLKYKLIINIKENEPTYIRSFFLQIKEDSVFLNNQLKLLENTIFKKSAIEETFKNILNYFENNGYPFASIKINSIFFYTDSSTNKNYVDLYLEINKEIKRKFDKILINGNTKTKDYVILRTIDIKEGDLYNQKKIENIPIKLNRLNFFEIIDTPIYYINSHNKGILKLNLKEKSTNNFDGIIGYVPSGNNAKGYFTGFLNLSFANLFGTARNVSIRWQKESKITQEFEIKYKEPWIINLPLNIYVNLFQRIQDTTYIQQKFESRIEYIATNEISASFIINSQPTFPVERKKKIFTVYNSRSITTGFNFKVDTRDNYLSPHSGILFSNSYLLVSKKILGPKEFINNQAKTTVSMQKYEFDFEYFREIFSNQIAALKIHARELRGSNIEISDMYLLGGANSLRGYREKQFLGNRIFWSNIEYRYLFSKKNFTFIFFDSGYYLQSEDIIKNNQRTEGFKIGYGFGINLETSIGMLNISFALAKGDSFSEGKIHFGILSEF
ncbi:MAG: BamA/TamA family outer membrane protein [Melioribacter sp.]|nr:BamA/TamA family outer membrane protein [Melioribacter sp.]